VVSSSIGDNNMSIEGRLQSLKRKHNDLHGKIEALEAEKAPEKYIIPMKKQKLLIKDEISQLERG
jgi:hypothetical protein